MSGTTKKKSALFGKLETREDAAKAVRDCAGGFLVVAAINGLVGVFLLPAMLIDAALLGGLALIMRKWQARWAAVVLLLLSLFILVSTVGNRLGITSQGGTNVFLAILMVIVGFRSVQATFMLAKQPTTPPPTMAPRMPVQPVRR